MRIFWDLEEETLSTSGPTLNMRRKLLRVFPSPGERSLKWLTHFMTANWVTGWPFAVTMTTSCWKKASSQTKAGLRNCMHVFVFAVRFICVCNRCCTLYITYSKLTDAWLKILWNKATPPFFLPTEQSKWLMSRMLHEQHQAMIGETSGGWEDKGQQRRKTCVKAEKTLVRLRSQHDSLPMRGLSYVKVGPHKSLSITFKKKLSVWSACKFFVCFKSFSWF